eukprot:CAMPEP_0195120682 /NCGR_PEP_ID=MMETSP0448-20130528/122374_1 /TAXON_ID=66468 /ORGANISM="Heterocapsa triquestra, Strain CCMP 448" /LENGTH=32 /DNA_ID= /DNA_START= /DNA_END= /DNA_ORIENTATION=
MAQPCIARAWKRQEEDHRLMFDGALVILKGQM